MTATFHIGTMLGTYQRSNPLHELVYLFRDLP